MQKVAFISIILFSAISFSSFRPNKEKQKLNWLTLTETEENLKKEPRPVLIDLYTDWCGWCKVMDRKTYANQNVIQYLNEKFYVVKLNAETKADLTWKGKVYRYNAAYKTNELAISLTNGDLSYPTTIFLPTDNSAPQTIAGMIEVKDMELITKYFGENKYGVIAFDDYAKKFKHSWK
jgi:thioredoxin-related protein